MKVKIIKHCGVEYDGVLYGPNSEPFDLPDEMAAGLVERGTCEAVVEPEPQSEPEPEPELVIVSPEAFVPSDEPVAAEPETVESNADTPDEPVATPDEPDTSDADTEQDPVEEPDEDTVDEPKRKKRGRRKKK